MPGNRRAVAAQITNRPALNAFASKGQRALVGPLGNSIAFDTDSVPGPVHHDEHIFKAPVFLSHKITHSTALVPVRQHRRWAAMDAQLVFQ